MQSNRVPSLEHSGWHFCSKELELCSQWVPVWVSALPPVGSWPYANYLIAVSFTSPSDQWEKYHLLLKTGADGTHKPAQAPSCPLLWLRLPSEPHSLPTCSLLHSFAGCEISHQSKTAEWNWLWEPGFLSLWLITLKSFASLLLKMKTCINKLAVSFSPGHCCTLSCSSIPRGSQTGPIPGQLRLGMKVRVCGCLEPFPIQLHTVGGLHQLILEAGRLDALVQALGR